MLQQSTQDASYAICLWTLAHLVDGEEAVSDEEGEDTEQKNGDGVVVQIGETLLPTQKHY